MNESQKIKRLLLPYFKGLRIVLGAIILSVLVAVKTYNYQPIKYQSTAKLKLDYQDEGISNSLFFNNIDLLFTTNKITTEVQVLQSRELIKKILFQLDLSASYYRNGRIRTSEMYSDSPFKVELITKNDHANGEPILLEITSIESFTLIWKGMTYTGVFGSEIFTPDFTIRIHLQDDIVNSRQFRSLMDTYSFVFNSVDDIINEISSELDVIAVDEDIAIVRVSYSSSVAEKAADIVNALAETYILDFIQTKTEAAGKTLEFLDNKLINVLQSLRESEYKLEQYRLRHKIINIRQETDTHLKKVSELKMDMAKLEMRQAAIDSVNVLIQSGGSVISDLAPGFEVFSDLVFVEMIKSLRELQAEKQDLETKFTPYSPEIKIINQKIDDITVYLKEGVQNAKTALHINKLELQESIIEAEKEYIDLPTVERHYLILEREFLTQQKTFNFLTEKRIEAAIAEAATISFHRVIEYGVVPKTPTTPNRNFIAVVAGFLGLLMGLGIVFLREFLAAKTVSRMDVEKKSSLPIAGALKHFKNGKNNKTDSFFTLVNQLKLTHKSEITGIVAISSSIHQEGKTFVAVNIASAFAATGYSVALVDFNLRKPGIRVSLKEKGISDYILGSASLDEIISKTQMKNLCTISAGLSLKQPGIIMSHAKLTIALEELKSHFDIVVVDTSATTYAIEGIRIMKEAFINLFVIRINKTKQQYLYNADQLAEQYNLLNMHIILNGVHQASNFNASFSGSRYSYEPSKLGIINSLRHYTRHYLK
jgi:capsular exopolysaccharide synthesis family protein